MGDQLIGWLIAFTGAVLGYTGARAYYTAVIELMKIQQRKEMMEPFDEVKRLRAQVAELIGKE